jgi:hypothetical protein
MKTAGILALAIMGAAGLAACESEPESTPLSRMMEAQRDFQEADGNKDGVVSQNEASAVPSLDFASADTDHNGALTPEEFEAARLKDTASPG